jgi:hypothetical protein
MNLSEIHETRNPDPASQRKNRSTYFKRVSEDRTCKRHAQHALVV